MSSSAWLQDRWPALAAVPPALAWLRMRANLGLAHRTIDAYARGLSEYLAFSAEAAADPLSARCEHVARFVRHLTERPLRHAGAGSPSSACPTPPSSSGSRPSACSTTTWSRRDWCRARLGCRGSQTRQTGA